MKAIRIAAAMFALVTLPFAAIADDDDELRHSRHGTEYEHKYREGNCTVERKLEKDGDFEEKIECKGGRYGGHARSKFKEAFRDGNCKVKRELEADGEYTEERKCKGRPLAHAHDHVYSMPQPAVVIQPVYVPTHFAVVEPGIPMRDAHIRAGVAVFHDKFGEGRVLAVQGAGNEARARVNFSRHGTKWLALSIGKLTPMP